MAEPDPQTFKELRDEIAQLRRSLAEIELRVARMADHPQPTPPPIKPAHLARPAGQAPQPVSPPPVHAEPAAAEEPKPVVTPDVTPDAPADLPTAPPAEPTKPEPVQALSQAPTSVAADKKPPEELPEKKLEKKPPRVAKASVSLEQRLGTSWLVKIGVVVLFLAAVFLFQYSVQQGWINETVRVFCVAGLGAGLLVLGEWALRKKMGIFSAAVTGGGIGLLYAAAFAASPNFYKLIPTPAAFALMCGVTILAVALSLRSGVISTAILAQIGAYLTPLLLSSGVDRQVALMTYMVILAAGFLVVAAARRWQILAPICFVGTVSLFVGWMAQFYGGAALALTMMFAWMLLGVFLAYAALATRLGRADERMGIGITAAGGALLTLLLLATGPTTTVTMMHLLELNIVVLGVCLFRGWQWLRAGAMAWTAMVFVACLSAGTAWSTVWWGWAMFALFIADVAIRHLLGRADDEKLTIGLTASAGALLVVLMLTLSGESVILPHLLALNAIMLGACLWRRWNWLRVGVLGWTAISFYVCIENGAAWGDMWWGWAMFALVMADVAAQRLLARSYERLETGLAAWAGGLLVVLMLSLDGTRIILPHLLALNVIILGICLWRRWHWLRVGVLVWTAVAFGVCMARGEAWSDVWWGWVMFSLLMADVIVHRFLDRSDEQTEIGLTASAGALLAILLLLVGDGWVALPHLLALDAAVLGMCLWRRWNWLRAGVLAWTAACFLGVVISKDEPALFYAMWAWILFALLTADVLIRAWLPRGDKAEKLDATLATLTTALMYGATYWLLKGTWSAAAMGWYTGSIGAGLIVLSIILRVVPRQRRLGLAYLGQGLTLLALAVPIAFDMWAVTISWSVGAVVAMLLASRLKEKLLLAKSPILLYLAGMHLVLYDIPEFGSTVWFTVGGLGITVVLALTASVVAAAVLAAALLRLGEVIWQDRAERTMCLVLVCAGAAMWFWQALGQLPVVPATWAWWLFAAGAAAVAIGRRSLGITIVTCVLLALCVVRFVFHDTLGLRLAYSTDAARMTVFNWQFAVGLLIAAAAFVFGRLLPARLPKWRAGRMVYHVGILAAAVLVVWAGSFEVDRYIARSGPGAAVSADQARQMGLSIWWAIWAVALLIAGFVWRYSPGRWLALGLFGLTLGKVLLLDMSRVETGYRILSFFALGALLVGASLLYQRHFQPAKLPAAEDDAESL